MAELNEYLLNYRFSGGINQGETLVYCLLTGDYDYWYRRFSTKMKEDIQKSPGTRINHLYLSLKYLLPIIHKLRPLKMCPYCNERPVAKFLLRDYDGILKVDNTSLMACIDEVCKLRCKHESFGFLREINFHAFSLASIHGKREKIERSEIMPMLAEAYYLPDDFNSETAISYLQSRISGSLK